MTRGPDAITVAIVVGSLALGLSLSHVQATHGDHERIQQLQGDVQRLRDDNRALQQRVGVMDDRTYAQLTDVTMRVGKLEQRAAPARASRTRRALPGAQRLTSSAQWARTRDAVLVANCESADLPHWPESSGDSYVGDAHLRDPNGHDGKWQFAPATWRSVGGSGRAYDATEDEQDYRAWLLWKREGWQPWTCARKLGIS